MAALDLLHTTGREGGGLNDWCCNGLLCPPMMMARVDMMMTIDANIMMVAMMMMMMMINAWCRNGL